MKINGITLYRTTEAGRYFHAHPYYQLHFILSGVGSYEIAGRCAIKARPELFFVVPPNRLHRISLPGNRPLLEYLIDMAPEADDDPVKKLLDSELGGMKLFDGVSINRKYFEAKREQFGSDNPYARRAAELGLLSWLYAFCSRKIAIAHGVETQKPDVVELALEILQENIEKPLDLEMLARRVGINRFSLVRKFSDQVGISPMKYYARLKLECAAILLRESVLEVGTIAERLCFADPYHFSKRFKAAYAVSPSSFRKQARQSLPIPTVIP